jgi:hypothetical protein
VVRQSSDEVKVAAGNRTRPLKTGRNFVVIIPRLRVTSAVWDKTFYDAEEEAELNVNGVGLEQLGSLEVAVERAAPDGAWEEVARVPASLDGDRVVSRYRMRRVAAAAGFAAGHLVRAEFGAPELERGEPVEMRVETHGLEGETLQITVEREAEGVYLAVGKLSAYVEDGSATARWTPPVIDTPAPLTLGPCSIELSGASANASCEVKAEGLDGGFLQIVLEREQGGGFVELASTAAQVRNGKARATLTTGESP